MPDCGYVYCWYIVQTPYTLTQAQHDFFKYPGQPYNIRNNNLSTNLEAYQTVYNLAPFKIPPAGVPHRAGSGI